MAEFNLERSMRDILQDYSVEVAKAAEEAVTEVAKEASKKLRQTSPKGSSGKYARGWSSKIDKTTMTIDAVVYGKTGTYQLAHLLENGHAKRGGGRVGGKIHIKPIEEWAISEVEKRIREKVER